MPRKYWMFQLDALCSAQVLVPEFTFPPHALLKERERGPDIITVDDNGRVKSIELPVMPSLAGLILGLTHINHGHAFCNGVRLNNGDVFDMDLVTA